MRDRDGSPVPGAMTQPVGFLGVGTIATTMIAGLRQSWPDLPIHLSPRSEAASRQMAEQDGRIVRHGSNAEVVEASGIVFLTMRPPQLDAAVQGLPFRDGQVVASALAGTPLAEIERLVAPASACRVLPLPMIARREGPLGLYAAPPSVTALLAGLGDAVDAPDEAVFDTYMAASASMSTFFALQAALARWLEGRGATPEGAAAYVRSLHRALAETSQRTAFADLPALVAEHETAGGLNQRVRTGLERQGWFDGLVEALDGLASLQRADLRTADE